MQAHFERRLHTVEVAELRLARAVAQVSAQIFCPQCSRLRCLAQLNLLKLCWQLIEAAVKHLPFAITLVI